MVVCKFFLKGTCTFGDRCRFEHPRNTSEYNAYPSSQSNYQQGGGRPSYGGQYQGQGRGYQQSYRQESNRGSFESQNRFAALGDGFQGNSGRGGRAGPPARDPGEGGGNADPKPGEILESIKRDAEEWDASGMWPYSSYRPTRALANLPEMLDMSPEELRLEAYFAEKENRFETYKSAVSSSVSALKRRKDMLKKPSGELKNALITVYRGQYKAASYGGQSIFGMQGQTTLDIFSKSGSTLFRPSTAAGSFQSASPPTGLFSSPGGGSTAPGAGFGAAPASLSSPPHGLFGKPAQNAAPGTPFGAQPAGFGSGGGGLFGKPAGPQPAGGLFGKPAQPGSAGLLGKPPAAAQGPFGQASSQATGLFGKPVPSAEGGSNVEGKWYTPASDLTAEEKEQFVAPSFTLGKIPTRPPPVELVKAAVA